MGQRTWGLPSEAERHRAWGSEFPRRLPGDSPTQIGENPASSLFLGDMANPRPARFRLSPLRSLSTRPCGLPRRGVHFMFYKENEEKNFVFLLINREGVQLATLELHPPNIKLGLL